jgi:flagellar motor switch protein FliN/FliY
MTQPTVDQPRLDQIIEAMGAAAAAAGAALPLPEPVQPGAAVLRGRPILFEPPAHRLSITLTGPVSGELVLVLDADTLAQLEAQDADVAQLLTPALLSAADAFGSEAGSVTTPTHPADGVADIAVPLSLMGLPVAGLELYRAPDRTPAVEHVVLDVTTAGVAATARPTVPVARKTTGTGRLDQLTHVEMEVTVEIGRTRMTVGELLSLTPGQVVELDRAAGAPVDLYVNGTLLARGEIVVVDEDFGFRVTDIVSTREG